MMKAKLNIILAILLAACASHLVLAHGPFDTRDGLPAALPLPQPLLQRIGKRGNDNTTGLRYYNQNTSQFYVPGTSIPDVDFDVGESYAGLLPISSHVNETRELFFWFFPGNISYISNITNITTTTTATTTAAAAADDLDLVIWLNGGPGCSSLEGLLQENGPFLWKKGTWRPVANPYSWNQLANVLWVEQPVGTGYTRGEPNITDEADLARQFLGFLELWLARFDLRGRRIFVTGESYAGQYVPYIVDAMYARNDSALFNPRGLMIFDPAINTIEVMYELPAVPFVESLAPLLGLNASFMGHLHEQHRRCGYEAFLAQNLVFPPPSVSPSPLPRPPPTTVDCDLWTEIYRAMLLVNPCFNIYDVRAQCPLLWDVLGYPASGPFTTPGTTLYFDRSDVQRALHVPPPQKPWILCSDPVFPRGDASPPSGLSVLPGLIERNERTVVAHGEMDYVQLSNGTLLTIQNMTWAGRQGFHTRPGQRRMVVPFDQRGDAGVVHEERGLTWVYVDGAGHMVPDGQPATAFWMLYYLLGFVESLDGGL